MSSQKWMSVQFFIFFFTWGVFLPYWTGYLTNVKDMSVYAASLIMGAGMIARAFSTLVLFPELTKRYSIHIFLRILALGSLLTFVLYIPLSSFIMLLLITVLFSLVYPNLLPAMESCASLLMQRDRIHYGRSRSFGSAGFMAAVLTIGFSTAQFGEEAILWVMIAALAFVVLASSWKAPEALTDKPIREDQQSTWQLAKVLLKQKEFLAALVIVVLIQGSHASYNSYSFIYLQDIGVSNGWIGVIINVAVLAEIVLFMVADRFFGKSKVSTLFMIAAVGATVRWVAIWLFPIAAVFIATQALHAISFGLAHYAFIQFIARTLHKSAIPTAQGLYAAFAMSLSSALLTFLGGYLYDIQAGYAFLGMALFSFPAIVLLILQRDKLSY
ncbi:MFS transporter [Chryseomicrobium sp. FSL W7-1435]|uniref:MFS transporter n=1 Tax=Chryseomicrobium sp. FSL W7-1435 TaxID=2921704 RepID=UPI00315AD4D0